LAAVDPDLEGLKAAQDLLATDISNGRTALETLARRGSVLAMLALAKSFRRASPANLLQAELWFREAYERGALDAFPGLAICHYKRGETTAAEKIYTEGAARGDAVSMEWLAQLKLDKGPQNITEVANLLREAASQGQVRAGMRLAHLEMQGKLGLHMIPVGIARIIYSSFDFLRIGARDLDDRLLQ
jgi:TPR repeat protein